MLVKKIFKLHSEYKSNICLGNDLIQNTIYTLAHGPATVSPLVLFYPSMDCGREFLHNAQRSTIAGHWFYIAHDNVGIKGSDKTS